MTPIKVLIVDDSALVREVISELLSEDKAIQVVAPPLILSTPGIK